MKAWTNDEYGSPEVLRLREVESPVPGPDQVLIRVKAASVNPYDWHLLTGAPYLVRLQEGLRRPKGAAPGVDVSGVVEAAGENVTAFAPGDEAFGQVRGSYAEFGRGSEASLARKPARVSFEDAAAVPMAALTALQGLRDKGRVGHGDRVLINGASGGVGTIAIQIAKSLGAEVTGVCSSRNIGLVRSCGADHVVDYSREDFTRSGRYDVVFDAVGTRSVLACRRAIAPGGTYVGVSSPKTTFGALGRVARLLLVSLIGRRRMVPMLATVDKDDLSEIARLLDAGSIEPVIERQYSLDAVPEALRDQGNGHARGKKVIAIG